MRRRGRGWKKEREIKWQGKRRSKRNRDTELRIIEIRITGKKKRKDLHKV